MADLSPEQMEEMAATMRLPPEQRSIGQVGSLMDLVAHYAEHSLEEHLQNLNTKLILPVGKPHC